MKRDEMLARQIERDADDPSAWEEDPAPTQKRTLGSQVTIRLDPEMAGRLREVARRERTGYTSLLRTWIEDRVRAEESRGEVVILASARMAPAVTYTGNALLFQVSPGKVTKTASRELIAG